MTVRKKVSGRTKKTGTSSTKNNVSRSSSTKISKARKGTVMTRKKAKQRVKKDSLIGIDPLAWLNEEIPDADIQEQEEPENVANGPVIIQQDASEKEMDKDQPVVEPKDVSPGGNIIHMGVSITIREVNELFGLIKDRLNQDQTIRIDCSELEKMDASGLQLLTVLKRHAAISGIDVEWITPGDKLIRSADLLGLTTELALSA